MTRVLCLHGLGGSAATMAPVVAACADAGLTAFVPTLPGHGGVAEDLLAVGWQDWLHAAGEWPADVIVGQSMGAALGLAIAAGGGCRAVVCINPPAADGDALEALEWRGQRGQHWVEVGPSAVAEVAYERLPLAAVMAMISGVLLTDLTAVRQPVLIITSADDDVVDPACSDIVAAALGGTVQRLILARSGHVATLDCERERVARAVVDFARDA